jgi:hypothetical protein
MRDSTNLCVIRDGIYTCTARQREDYQYCSHYVPLFIARQPGSFVPCQHWDADNLALPECRSKRAHDEAPMEIE